MNKTEDNENICPAEPDIQTEDLKFRLEVFEGPLDLLLNLINKNKIDIYDIPISLIFDQYTEYLDRMRELNMEVAGEFIVMATELMLIKSKMLLPKTDEEKSDPRLDLTAALLEYRKIRQAAGYFGERVDVYGGSFIKDPEDISPDEKLLPHSTEQLVKAFRKISARTAMAEKLQSEPQRTLNSIIRRHTVPVQAKILTIIRYLYLNGKTEFEMLMEISSSHFELIAIFAALLQLIKSGRVIMEETGRDDEYDEDYAENDACGPDADDDSKKIYLTLNMNKEQKADATSDRNDEEYAN